MWPAAEKFVSAIFNGVARDEVEKYTALTTGAIGLYICCVAVFLVGLYLRRLHMRRLAKSARLERETAAFALACATLVAFSGTAVYLVYFLIHVG
jgi:hypothetical protein